MVQDVGPGVEDDRQRLGIALAVGDEHLDRGARRAGAHRADRRREHARAAVGHVVAGHAGDDGVGETELGDGVGDVLGLLVVERERMAGVDEAEPARTRAPIAEDHERGGLVGPAFVDVGAARLLAHRVQ